MYRLAIVCIYLFLASHSSAAGFGITEVLYDAEGSDSGHEWIEIYNDTGSAVTLTEYTFVESGGSHKLVHYTGEAEFASGSYAIIADNPATFIEDNPGVSTVHLYDSSFSLSNTGEPLSLKNADGEILFTFTYDPSIGAAGDGKSLQKNSSGTWVAQAPTPGAGLTAVELRTADVPAAQTQENSSLKKESSMKVMFDIPKSVITGNTVQLKGVVLNTDGQKIDRGVFVWNFGDGKTVTSLQSEPIHHVYTFPGTYTISYSYSYPYTYSGPLITGKTKVVVIDSPLVLKDLYSQPFSGVRISNTDTNEYDIGGYILRTKTDTVSIPLGTYIGADDDIVITLPAGNYVKKDITLLSPSGYTAAQFASSGPIAESVDTTLLLANVVSTEDAPNEDIDTVVGTVVSLDDTPDEEYSDTHNTGLRVVYVIVVAGILLILLRVWSDKSRVEADEFALQDE